MGWDYVSKTVSLKEINPYIEEEKSEDQTQSAHLICLYTVRLISLIGTFASCHITIDDFVLRNRESEYSLNCHIKFSFLAFSDLTSFLYLLPPFPPFFCLLWIVCAVIP